MQLLGNVHGPGAFDVTVRDDQPNAQRRNLAARYDLVYGERWLQWRPPSLRLLVSCARRQQTRLGRTRLAQRRCVEWQVCGLQPFEQVQGPFVVSRAPRTTEAIPYEPM